MTYQMRIFIWNVFASFKNGDIFKRSCLLMISLPLDVNIYSFVIHDLFSFTLVLNNYF